MRIINTMSLDSLASDSGLKTMISKPLDSLASGSELKNSELKNVCSNEKKLCFSERRVAQFITEVMKETPSGNADTNLATVSVFMKDKYGCTDQSCWGKYSKIFAIEAKNVIKPKPIWNKEDRLVTNIDIRAIFSQYENHNINFKYLGDYDHDLPVVKEDRETLSYELSNSGNIEYRAIIISLWGVKWKLLKHWTCILLVKSTQTIIFFDSNGDSKTSYEICPLIEWIKKEVPDLKYYMYCTQTVQYDYEHCGLFCIHFINEMVVHGKTFKEFIEDMSIEMDTLGKEDFYDYMMDLRKKYFLTE